MSAAKGLVIIGGSAGSLDAIIQLLAGLKNRHVPPIIIVLHRKTGDDSTLAELLSIKSPVPVKEADEKDPIRSDTIYIAPADYHLLVEQDHTISLDYSEKINYSRPSIDISFQTAAEAYGKSLTAILLSGANADGTEGLKAVKACGGRVIIQNPATAEVAYMPQHALEKAGADLVLNANEIPMVI
ncbi:chemotaxis protein CheB [Hufsiella ginkgonis]|uniref:protein-glutamate methylesterase n=1 Tax=Hufsiella ginkgonis TaxID=2695274 RepID=A0A7K1XSE3_9SPHI|nr:chemotaxis protein CheB [Hufsiella ginkgonis]MXV13933.1 chemotaxis protein CheB [Hufsiella ginkgonis]